MEGHGRINYSTLKRVNLSALFSFYILVRKSNYEVASETLSIPRYQLYRDLRTLEAFIGGDIVSKDRRTLRLTTLGRSLTAITNEMFNSLHLLDDSDITIPEITISCTNAFAKLILPKAMKRLREYYPKLSITVLSGAGYQDFESSGCDVIVGRGFSGHDSLAQFRLADYSYAFFASEDYLRTKPAIKSADDFREHPLILPKGFGKTVIDQGILEQNWIYAESTIVDVQSHSAELGQGIALLPIDAVVRSDLNLVRVLNGIEYEVPLTFSFRQSSFKKGILLRLKEIVVEEVTKDLADLNLER